MPKFIEVASYPKCGNTWVRYILANVFNVDVHIGIPDIHQQREKTSDLIQIINLSEPVGFYKSHVLDAKSINPYSIIWIYRHPLDVFLSCMNYFFITKDVSKFINNELKSVEELVLHKQLDSYFNNFNENLGSDFYPELLGQLSNYGLYVDNAFSNKKVFSIRYEDLIDEPILEVKKMLNILFPNDDISVFSEQFQRVDKATKNSGQSFYWKSRKNNYESYLTPDQIDCFYQRWDSLLKRLKYY